MTGAADKLMTLADAAALVNDGDTVVAGGCCYSRTPWAMLLELLRAQRRGLTLGRNLMCYESELFLATGAATKLVSSWVGIGLRWGIPKVFREYVERDPSVYEEWSHLSFGLRLMAASMGMPFLPTASLLGSDLLQRLPAQEMRCPFTDELLVAVPALVPDVALIHVHTVDAAGNAQIEGPAYMDVELARAAKTVIVTAEEVVPAEAIVRHNDRTQIPGFVVDAVVEVPFGSYPHECHGRYEADFAHFDAYAEQVAADGVAGVEAYLAEVRRAARELRRLPGHGRGLGAARAAPPRAGAGGGMSAPNGAATAEPTPVELMTIAGSRLLRDGRVVFAGVGVAAGGQRAGQAPARARRSRSCSRAARSGRGCCPGRLPVSTNEMRAAHDAFMLTSINELFLYGQRGCYDYGFIGAGQLDQYGNVNTSYIGDPDHPKVRLPGSGGANDIVSSCREVMIMTRHEQRRFVERVDFITSPGYLSGPESRRAAGLVRNRPVAVITDLALLGFDEATGRLRLDALQPGVTEADVHANTGFELLVSDTVAELAAPTEQELAELRWLRDGEQSNTATRREVTSAP